MSYHLYIPGGGFWTDPCIWSKNGLIIWPIGVYKSYLAWFLILLGIPWPIKN